MIIKETWTDADILEAVNQCNNKKVLGEDWLTVSLLKDKDLSKNLRE